MWHQVKLYGEEQNVKTTQSRNSLIKGEAQWFGVLGTSSLIFSGSP